MSVFLKPNVFSALCIFSIVLVDGGYVDNLPCLTMKAMGASRVFAIDVGGIDDSSLRSYGDSVSGFWILLNKYGRQVLFCGSLPERTSRLRRFTTSTRLIAC